jgi:hypothetical protein
MAAYEPLGLLPLSYATKYFSELVEIYGEFYTSRNGESIYSFPQIIPQHCLSEELRFTSRYPVFRSAAPTFWNLPDHGPCLGSSGWSTLQHHIPGHPS